jgi:hypothetical protein
MYLCFIKSDTNPIKKHKMATGNLFSKAKVKAVKNVDKKNDKLNIHIPGDEFDKNLVQIVELQMQIDMLEAQLIVAQGYVKEIGQKTFVDVYTKTGGYPGSFIMSSDSQASFLMVPMDKYIKCDETRFNELKESYGEDVVTEKTEFVLNPVLLDKYGEVLSDLIQNSPDIDDDDKDELFQAKIAYSVSKGAIEKAFTWGKGKVSDFIRDIQPIFAMKGAKTQD